MNYYNPYFNMYPAYTAATSSPGLFGRLLGGGGGIKWGSILSGTQKVLNIANQAIPVIRQVSPVMKNAKTMFRVMNEFKKVDTPAASNASSDSGATSPDAQKTVEEMPMTVDGPTFFI